MTENEYPDHWPEDAIAWGERLTEENGRLRSAGEWQKESIAARDARIAELEEALKAVLDVVGPVKDYDDNGPEMSHVYAEARAALEGEYGRE